MGILGTTGSKQMRWIASLAALLFVLAGCESEPCLLDPDEMIYPDLPDYFQWLDGEEAEQAEQAEQTCGGAIDAAAPVVTREVLDRERETDADLIECTFVPTGDGEGTWWAKRVVKDGISDDWWNFFLLTHVPGEELPYICADTNDPGTPDAEQVFLIVGDQVYRARSVICDIGVITGDCPDNPIAS